MNLKEDLSSIDFAELTGRMFADLDGSFNAEYGIWRKLVAEIELRQDAAEFALIQVIKQAVDPAGRFSPDVLLRQKGT